jgi:hypothetical protein
MAPRYARYALAAAALAATAGCFDEPTPAYKTVPEGARVYLQDKGLKDLAGHADALKPGLVDYVNLDRNAIETFPPELAALGGLRWLRLNGNRLSDLPDLSSLVALRRIYLRSNRFTAVPEALRGLPSLTDVDLSLNPLSEVPQWLVDKKGLENVSISETMVTKLPDDLSGWKTLTSLQLGGLKMSAEEMARIRAALPGVAIVF